MTTTIHTDTPARFAATLRRLSACQPARKWAAGLDYATAWATCTKPDWLLWLLDTAVLLDTKTNELLVCRFAREVLHLNPDPRVLACIETREAWARGEATYAARAAAWAGAGAVVWAAAGAVVQSNAWAAARDAAGAAVQSAAGAAARDAAGAAAWDAARAAVQSAARDAAGAAVQSAAWAAARAAAEAAARSAAGAAARAATWAAARDAAGVRQCEIIRQICPMPILL